MGDIILTLPVVEALKKRFPHSEVVFLCKKQYKDLVVNHPHLQEVVEFDPQGKHKGIAGFLELIKELRQRRIDLILDLHSNFRSFFIRKLIPSRLKIRCNKRWLSRFLMVHLKRLEVRSRHTLDCYMETLKKLTLESEDKILRFYLNDQEKAWAEEFLSEKGGDRGTTLVGMAPGARWKTKSWNREKFAKVGQMLSSRVPSNIILLGDKSDAETIDWMAGELSRKEWSGESLKIIKAVDLPLNKVASVLQMCNVLVTNDSGLMHLASFLRVPVVAIFGPTHTGLGFAPLGRESVVVSVNEKCSPCSLHGKRKCLRKERYCMDKILPEEVAQKASRFLGQEKAVFVDRDGTLIQERNFISRLEQVEFVPGSIRAVKMLKDLGYHVIIISNQSGIGREILTKKVVEEINDFILNQLKKSGIGIDGVYYCPHRPDENCSCRKPNLGLIDQASWELNLNSRNSWVIGDKLSDVTLARNMGGRGGLVLTGYGKKELERIKQNSETKPDFVAEDLLGAALWIQREDQRKADRLAKQNS